MNQHLDPERLASLMEGTLSRAERAAVEAHAADCGDCLQLLAAMVRTEPAVPARSWRLLVVARWAVPIAAGATAVALWVNVDRGAREPQSAPPEASVTDAIAPAPAPVPPGPTTSKSAPAGAAAARRDRQESVPPRAQKETAKSASPSGESREAGGERFTSLQQEAKKDARSNEALLSRTEDSAPRPAASPAPASPTPMTQAPQVRVLESPAARAARGPVVALDILSPDPLVRWRVRGTFIEQTIDGGNTWAGSVVTFNAELLAGSSPSRNVAWLVGRGGTGFLTTDGKQWHRLQFPEAVDLTGIRARNEREADVTTVDGRVFRTSDGGLTWALQEIPGSSF